MHYTANKLMASLSCYEQPLQKKNIKVNQVHGDSKIDA